MREVRSLTSLLVKWTGSFPPFCLPYFFPCRLWWFSHVSVWLWRDSVSLVYSPTNRCARWHNASQTIYVRGMRVYAPRTRARGHVWLAAGWPGGKGPHLMSSFGVDRFRSICLATAKRPNPSRSVLPYFYFLIVFIAASQPGSLDIFSRGYCTRIYTRPCDMWRITVSWNKYTRPEGRCDMRPSRHSRNSTCLHLLRYSRFFRICNW